MIILSGQARKVNSLRVSTCALLRTGLADLDSHQEAERISANVLAVSDVPEPGAARRRHVRRPNDANLHGIPSGGKAAPGKARQLR